MSRSYTYYHTILFTIFALLLISNRTHGQLSGNEWIDYNQSYYKINVAQTGLYRITYNDLLDAGFPVQTVDPRKIQLYFRGEEQAIEVSGQLDARFDPSDHIVFYGQRNDGTLDKLLYVDAAAQPHDHYNLFSDTSAYFLTWRLDNTNGKRVSSFFENNINNLPAEPFYFQKNLQLVTVNYSAGRTYPEGSDGFAQITEFDFGEGWTGARIGINQNGDFLVKNLIDLHTSGTNPQLEVLLAGRNNRPHKVEIFAGNSLTSLRSLGEVQFNYYNNYKFTASLEWTDIASNGDLHVRVRAKGFGDGIPDFVSVSYVQLTVPRQWKIAKDTSHVTELSQNMLGKSFVQISNTLSAFSIYDITDPYQLVKIGFNHSGNTTTAMVNHTNVTRKLLIHNNKYLSATVKKVGFTSINPALYNYLIISHKDLMKPTTSYSDPIKAYADYRASAIGGGYKPIVVEVDQLFDQFSYGEKSPIAIRRFCQYMLRDGQPQYLFLIGKGMDITYNYYRQNPATYPHVNLIPPAGYPASDINFTAGLQGSTYEPAIATGRFTAKTPENVEAYLNKVKEMELVPYNALWRKELINLSGGLTAIELNLFNNYIKDFKSIADNDYLGGNTTLVSKKSNYSTELINISDALNTGKALVTFFGHSAGSVTDLDIGYVSNEGFGYNNKGKYPVFLINGCNAGQIFSTEYTMGEDWMLTPNKGAIGFLASVSLGYAGYLKRYSDYFYSTAFADEAYINKSLGEIQQEVSRRYMENITPNPLHITQVQQIILQGDPSYKMFRPEKPDFSITNTDLLIKTFSGEKVTAASDSFAIGAIVKNFGKTTLQPLSLTVERISENGSVKWYDSQEFDAVKHMDTLWFKVRKDDFEGFGKNYFTVYIDYEGHIDEMDKSNNAATFTYFIPLNSTRNVLPTQYAIVNSRNLELISQSSNLMAQMRDFILEIDTSANFNSPFKKQYQINARVLVKQKVQLLDKDSTVYFWRTRFAQPLPEEDGGWSTTSFTYIKDSPEGWAQSKFAQIRENSLSGMVENINTQTFQFIETDNEISLKTFGAAHPEMNHQDVSLNINGMSYIFSSRTCANNSINLVAFDKSSTIPYLGLNLGGWDINDRRTCGRIPQIVNNFINSEIENAAQNYLVKYIDNIPDGDYILLFSIGNVTYQNWTIEIQNKLQDIGISPDLYSKLQNGHPVIILGRKGGGAGSAIEILADPVSAIPPSQQEINLDHLLSGKFTEGSITSQPIGPATTWGTLFTQTKLPHSPNDSFNFDLIGIKTDASEETILANWEGGTTDISHISAAQFPQLKLKYYVKDAVDFTPALLNNWVIIFNPAPEGILLPANPELKFPITKQEGETFGFNMIFENISNKDFQDSITIALHQFNINKREATDSLFKIAAVKAGEHGEIGLNIQTMNRVGKNNIRIEANPRVIPEQYYFNNTIAIDEYLDVMRDKTNPVVDVLVDGRYIMDGDIVSPTPLILIRLKDDNKYLFKSDTAGVSILMKKECDECQFKRISFTSPQVKWTPGNANQDFQVEFQPDQLENGRYILQIQASDASGNQSGIQPYKVRFEVINEATITHFYPFPNPFSTSTRFVFTLTGSEVPEKISIQIMTISGKVVKELSQDELGPIRIGHNITQYAWDGKDEYGDQLANGVYFYKVLIQKEGKILEHRQTAGDRAFKKGFGKLYILR